MSTFCFKSRLLDARIEKKPTQNSSMKFRYKMFIKQTSRFLFPKRMLDHKLYSICFQGKDIYCFSPVSRFATSFGYQNVMPLYCIRLPLPWPIWYNLKPIFHVPHLEHFKNIFYWHEDISTYIKLALELLSPRKYTAQNPVE